MLQPHNRQWSAAFLDRRRVNGENIGTYLYWERDVTVDFGSGFAMEVAVTIVSSDDNFSGDTDWPRLGYMLYATGQNGKWFDMDLSGASIVLRNNPFIGEDGVNCRRMAFPVAGSQHVYHMQIDANGADLLIDGVIQNLHVPVSTTYTGAPNVLGFGDGTVWANSESYTRYVRYSGVEPTCCVAPCFHGLGDLPGGGVGTIAYGLSSDGTTVVGQGESANGDEAYRWRAETGMVGLGDLPGDPFRSRAVGVSADGGIVVGDGAKGTDLTTGLFIGFHWTQAGGMVALDDLPGGWFYSTNYSISDDGQFSCGQVAIEGSANAALYTNQNGWQMIHSTSGEQSNAYALSRNGQWVVGTRSYLPFNGIGDAYRWSAGTGLEFIGDLPGGATFSRAYGISNDGQVVVGEGTSDSGTEAFRWTPAGAMSSLGDLAGGAVNSIADSLTSDGQLIVGYGTSAAGQEAVLWDAGLAIHRVADVLAAGNVVIPIGWVLTECTAITINGNIVTICGNGTNPQGFNEAWIARFSLAAPCPAHTGDMNADSAANGGDVQRFTAALAAGSTAFADTCPGDFSNSGIVDLPDLPDFVDTLLAQ